MVWTQHAVSPPAPPIHIYTDIEIMLPLMTITRRRPFISLLSLLLPLLALTATMTSAQVRRMTLPEMVSAAGTIFIGTVVEARGALDERGDPVTYTTFHVEEAIKGRPGTTHTIKQYGGVTPTTSMLLQHMRYFRQGERVMAMFYPPSRLGFSSPVGMEQGVWSVENAMVQRVSGTVLGSMPATMKRWGLTARTTQSIPMRVFVGMVREMMSTRRDAR